MDKILMIKQVKDLTGCGLREAKDTVEGFLNGTMPEKEELMKIVAEKMKNRVPRSEEIRKRIRNHIKSINNLLEYLELSGDFDEEDLPELRETMEKVAYAALEIKDTWTYRLEDALFTEQEVI